MSGLEVLGAIAASIQIAGAIRSAIALTNDVRNSAAHASQQEDMHFRLLVQVYTFESWCGVVGISEVLQLNSQNIDEWKETPQAAVLQRSVEKELRLVNSDVANLTLRYVLRMRDKLEEAWTILQGYGQSPTQKDVAAPSTERTNTKPKWYKHFRNKGEENSSDRILSREAGLPKYIEVAKTVSWAMNGRKAFLALLKVIEETNGSLSTLLDNQTRYHAQRQTEIAILNRVTHDPAQLTGLAEDSDISALARLQDFQDHDCRRDITNPHASDNFRPPVYYREDIKGNAGNLGDVRSICQIRGKRVLVEWKFYSKEKPIRMERTFQLQNLVELLNRKGLYERFLAPKCGGLINDFTNHRVGMVFDIPATKPEMATPYQYQDLQTFIRISSTSSSAIPALEDRFSMAKKLALGMQQLHSVHWLHKSFRSDNIIFFQSPEADQTGSSTCVANPAPFKNLYIVGWNFSRHDDPAEFSESLSYSSASFQGRRQNMKLYSHPDVGSGTLERARYKAEFDIYSFGLVLLEIGLWRTLDMIREKCSSDEDFRKKVMTEYSSKLRSRTGTVYWRVTQKCLEGNFNLPTSEENVSGEVSIQAAFQKHVVWPLDSCCV